MTAEATSRPPFGDEHDDLRASIRRWAREELAPHADQWEREREFPRSVFERAAELGFLGLKFPEELGGQGGDHLHDAVWAEELTWCDSGGVAAGLGAHTGIASPPLFTFGTADQHEPLLRPAIAGGKVCTLGITEPGAGSDVASIRTTARRTDGGWVVNGSKTFITNGVRADVLVCACRTTAEGGHGGISFLILERDMPGYTVSRKLEKMGWHASDTAELAFDDVEVPEKNLLGDENGGFYLIMANFQWERLLMSLGAVGAMDRAIERTLAYASEREAFGKPIGRFQAIRHKLADAATTLYAARSMTYDALRQYHETGDAVREVTMAKLFTQRAAVDVIDDCLQIHGGMGYAAETGIERFLRDARLGPIGGGTDEVMREILGKQLGL
ncbi:MAG: acyl-CoA dehydrogenase family protein [Solirubrobacterales bacterium]